MRAHLALPPGVQFRIPFIGLNLLLVSALPQGRGEEAREGWAVVFTSLPPPSFNNYYYLQMPTRPSPRHAIEMAATAVGTLMASTL